MTKAKKHLGIFTFSFMLMLSLIIAFGAGTALASDDYITVEYPNGVTVQYEAPETPEELCASRINTDSVTLVWANTYWANADGFEIYKYSESTQKYTKVTTKKYENSTQHACKVTGLKSSTKYTFAVRSYVTIDGKKYYSKYSKRRSVSTSPKTPTITSVKYKSKGKMTVKWKSVSGVSGYIIQYSTSSKFAKKNTCLTAVSGASTTSKDIGGLAGKTYYVKVYAYKSYNGVKYASKASATKSTKITKGLTVKELINATSTTLDGRQAILDYTNRGVDIKKYSTTYDRFKAIYNWHAKHYKDFANCVACNSSFNSCIDALYMGKKKYDSFIWLAAGNFQNNNGSKVIHKWSVIYLAGVKYTFDPRLQGYTGNYTGTTYFGVTDSSKIGKKYLFENWYCSWREQDLTYFNNPIIWTK